MIPRTLVLKPLPTTQPQWKPKLLELRGMLAVLATLQKQAFCCDLDWVIIIMYHYYYCQQFGMFSKMVILQMRLATTTDTGQNEENSLPPSQSLKIFQLVACTQCGKQELFFCHLKFASTKHTHSEPMKLPKCLSVVFYSTLNGRKFL